MGRRLSIVVASLAIAAFAVPPATADNFVDVQTQARLGPPTSAYGLRVNLFDTAPRETTYVMAGPAQGFNNETTLSGSFFIDPQGLTMNTAPGANSFQMIAFNDGIGAGSKTRMIFHLNHANNDGWFINVWHWNDNINNYAFTGGSFFACASAACGNVANWRNNRIDFQWSAGNPGQLTMWRTRYLNGAPAEPTYQMFSVTVPGMQSAVINYVFAGMFTSQDPGTFGALYLDEFVFNR